MCERYFCNLYWNCAMGGRNRLDIVEKWRFNSIAATSFGGNRYEQQIVKDFLQRRNRNAARLFTDMLEAL